MIAKLKQLWNFGAKGWKIATELESDVADLRAKNKELEELTALARESANMASEKLLAERALSSELSQQCGNSKTALEKYKETVGSLENRLARTELETERLKAELSKTQADLARSQLDEEREKDRHTETRTIVRLLREWIHTTHRVDIPARNGTIKSILAGMKRLIVLILPILPLCLNAQFPPAVWRNAWSTNQPPRPVEGLNNLSVTNLNSGTNWQFYNVGPFTVARLTDVSNILGGAAGVTTNANQFLGTPLSIKIAALVTNLNQWGEFTNHGNIYVDGDRITFHDTKEAVEDGGADLLIGSDDWDQVIIQAGLGSASQLTWDGSVPNPQLFASVPTAPAQLGSPVLPWDNFWATMGHFLYSTGFVESTLLKLTNLPGLDRQLLFWHTNGQAYTAFSAPTNQWLPTNRFFITVTNPVAGQVLKFLSVSSANGVSSIVLTNDSDSNPALTTNANQFLGVPLSIKSGVLQTNVIVWSSNNTSSSLTVTSSIGSGSPFIVALTTNSTGLDIASNGVVKLTGPDHGPNTNAAVIFDTKSGTGNYVYWRLQGVDKVAMRTDSSANAVFGPLAATGEFYINQDGGNGTVHFALPNVADLWTLRPSSDVGAWHGGTSRRGQITNVWDIWGRTNLWLTRTSLVGGIVVTNDIRFLGHNSATGAVWTCTNTATGEGEWRGNLSSFQPASTTLTNLSNTGAITNLNDNQFAAETTIASIKDGALFTNAVFYPGSPGLTVTNIPGLGTNSFQLLNSNGQAVIFALTNNGLTLVASNAQFRGPQTNAEMLNVLGGVTNWIQSETKGTLYASSNLLVKSGQSTTNAWVGGTFWWDQNSWTNLNGVPGTLTNLSTNIVAGHMLTNNGDSVHVRWRVKLADAAANTNRFQIQYGSITVLDTGLQLCSNSVCQADLWVTRTGSTAQHADARFEWGPGSGAPFPFTNNNVELVQTNGIATIFQLRGSSQRVGAMTNNWTRAWYDPAPR